MKHMGSITGIIRSTDNVPMENVTIVIVGGPVHQDSAAITGPEGTFALNNLKPGNYFIKAFGEVVSDDISVPVIFNNIAFVEIWLEQVKVNGNNFIGNEESNWVSEDQDLVATKWKLKNIKPIGTFNAQGTRKTYILEFPTNDTYHLKLDVNECSGIYKVGSSGKINFRRTGCTEMCCDSPIAEKFAELIGKITRYEVRDNILLLSGNGEITLIKYFN